MLLPTRQTLDMAQFVSWTPGDHVDASRILMEHSEREDEPIGPWCVHWAGMHWALGKREGRKVRRARIRGAAEATILARRRR